MHAVALTHAFVRAAKQADEIEVDHLVSYLSENPTAGIEIAGTGGCRKMRLGGRGKGKSGGYRVVTFFTGEHFRVFALTVYSKGEWANLSKSECNALRLITKAIVTEYRMRG